MKILDILDPTYRVIKFRLDNPDLFRRNKEDIFLAEVYLAEDVDLIDNIWEAK